MVEERDEKIRELEATYTTLQNVKIYLQITGINGTLLFIPLS